MKNTEKEERKGNISANILGVEELLATGIKNWILSDEKKHGNGLKASSKRPATSPAKGELQKRSAFGNITNAGVIKKQVPQKGSQPDKENKPRRRSLRLQNKAVLSRPVNTADIVSDVGALKVSDDSLSSSQDSYSSASSEVQIFQDVLELSPLPMSFFEHSVSPPRLRLKHSDFDATNKNNVFEAPDYAFTIFEYMRKRERCFNIQSDYLSSSQTELTADMRAILVDWMVEVQENFELNHETLYLAVKLVDHYLQKINIVRERLQLVGATSMLIAAKFDERHPPYIDDFLYICDDAYNRRDLLAMERSILKLIDFDLNIPISYRFLRRYAKCMKSSMEVLTLARFILELSLQCYALVDRSASLLAAAALWLAILMKKSGHKWDDTMTYYTARTEQDVFELACELNHMVDESKSKKLKTIRQKYSHSIFYEVAKTPILTKEQLESEKNRIFSSSKIIQQHDRDSKEFIEL